MCSKEVAHVIYLFIWSYCVPVTLEASADEEFAGSWFLMALCKRSPRLFWLAAVAGFHAGILLFYVFNFSYTYVPHLPTAISVSNEILSGSAVDNSRQKRENENIIGTNWDKLSERQVRILNCSGLDVTNNTQRVPVDFNVVSLLTKIPRPEPYSLEAKVPVMCTEQSDTIDGVLIFCPESFQL